MFRFTIRDLLWLTVVVALAAAWWSDRRDAIRQRLDNQARIARQELRLTEQETRITAVEEMLARSKGETTALRQQLREYVATQEDKVRIDIAPGFFHRLPGAPN
jgi:septal ring factor EnvC (AmiA/AmiB activator)